MKKQTIIIVVGIVIAVLLIGYFALSNFQTTSSTLSESTDTIWTVQELLKDRDWIERNEEKIIQVSGIVNNIMPNAIFFEPPPPYFGFTCKLKDAYSFEDLKTLEGKEIVVQGKYDFSLYPLGFEPQTIDLKDCTIISGLPST